MSAPSDQELVRAYLETGHDASLVQLVRRYQIPLFRHLSHELADPDDAESVCEAVFVVMGCRLDEWSQKTSFQEWLFAVSVEVRNSRQGEAISEQSPRLVDPAVFFRQSVHRALHTLAPEDRALLIAADLEGNTPEQIAEREQLSLASVTESLHRVRAAFTETLSQPAASPPRTVKQTEMVKLGEVIDNRYQVQDVLGEGGMATVFRAKHLGIKRSVALKTLRPSRQAQAMIRERFVREAEVLGRLAHPNFVDVSDFGESDKGFSYMAMELLEGKPLSMEIEQGGPMGPKRALRILREVARGLEFAHAQGIIHRDIKPDNVVLLEDESQKGFAKILDLGIASISDDVDEDEPMLFGTPAYMAPEQIQGQRIDGRVDIYAAGVMLFEFLTAKVPFEGSTVQYLLVRQLTEAPPRLLDVLETPISNLNEVQALLDRCLAKDPAERFSSAASLGEEIDRLLELLEEDDSAPRRPRAPLLVQPPQSVPSESTATGGVAVWIISGGLILSLAGYWLWNSF